MRTRKFAFEIHWPFGTILWKNLFNWQHLFDCAQNLEYETNNETFDKRYVCIALTLSIRKKKKILCKTMFWFKYTSACNRIRQRTKLEILKYVWIFKLLYSVVFIPIHSCIVYKKTSRKNLTLFSDVFFDFIFKVNFRHYFFYKSIWKEIWMYFMYEFAGPSQVLKLRG